MGFLRRLFFQFWYFRRPPWDTGISPPELLEFLDSHPPGRALDLGCGTGTNVITLAQHGWKVTGVDFAWKAIGTARRKAQRANADVDLRVGDVTRLEGVSGPFDLILDMGCFHNLDAPGRQAYLANIERLLAPDGTFLLYTFMLAPDDESGHGVSPPELMEMAARLKLINREDGNDRGRRASAWLTFQPNKQP